jgi:hypothetical protein
MLGVPEVTPHESLFTAHFKYTPLQDPSLLIDTILLKLPDTNTLVSRTEELLETTIQETTRSVVSARNIQFTVVNHIYFL